MKNSLFIFLLLTTITANAQKIEGFVKDVESKQALPYVSVYISSTTIGTSTDSVGYYRLQNLADGKYTLVMSYLGYVSFQKQIEIIKGKNLKLDIELLPDKKALDEVKIKAKRDKTWERQFKVFEIQFLGVSAATKLCKILNPWVIDFENDGNILKATAVDVLQIQNDYLGYQIDYTLRNFVFDGTNTSIGGYARFVPLGAVENQKREFWTQNRQKAYRNSEIYFVKSLIRHQSKEAGFEGFIDKPGNNSMERNPYFYQIQLKKLSPFSLDSLMTKDEKSENWHLTLPRRFELQLNGSEGSFSIYKDKTCQVSWIESNGRTLIFNQNGLLQNPQDWAISGYLTNGRIAEILPLDYQPPTEFALKQKPNFWNDQVEKPFFTTDKSYYFKGEKIQVSGTMYYSNPEKAVAMSRILNIELINPKNSQIIDKQKITIENDGSFQAKITLSDSIPNQNYVLRAYTRWQRNWGDSTFAIQWIPVIARSENIVEELKSETNDLEITQRDSIITATVPEINEDQILWLSASVTNHKIVKNIKLPVIKAGAFAALPDTLKPKYDIERSVDLDGSVLDKKGKPFSDANVILVVPKSGLNFIVSTDSNGVFKFENLPIEGEQNILVKATDSKNRAIPNVQVKIENPVLDLNYGQDPELKTEPTDEPILINYPKTNAYNGVQLKEVEVKAKKVIPPPKSIYGQADYTVKGNELAMAAIGENILTALQGRIPGLRIVEKYDEFGLRQLIITLRGGNMGGLTRAAQPQPLVLVDGVPFEDVNQIIAIPPSRIASVEVYNKANNMTGSRGYNGVIAIYTKKLSDEVTNEFVKDPNIKALKINGITLYSTTESSNVFHWQPFVSINTMGVTTYSFTKPPKGNYTIKFEGISKKSKVIMFQNGFEVR